jgi:Peptidase A4 family
MPATSSNTNLLTTNWSGAVIPATASKSLAAVSAQWVVPAISQVPSQSLTDVSEWVGLDGYASGDVCQAGVLETVQTTPRGTTMVSCSAWDEWYPAGANTISPSALTINPGDTVRVTLETLGKGSTSAAFLFDNLTTGQTYQTALTAPAGTSLQGDSADFVVEAPDWQYGNLTFQPLLADFVPSPITFQQASAINSDGSSANLSSGLTLGMVTDIGPGFAVEEAYGAIQPNAVTVTENPYWLY